MRAGRSPTASPTATATSRTLSPALAEAIRDLAESRIPPIALAILITGSPTPPDRTDARSAQSPAPSSSCNSDSRPDLVDLRQATSARERPGDDAAHRRPYPAQFSPGSGLLPKPAGLISPRSAVPPPAKPAAIFTRVLPRRASLLLRGRRRLRQGRPGGALHGGDRDVPARLGPISTPSATCCDASMTCSPSATTRCSSSLSWPERSTPPMANSRGPTAVTRLLSSWTRTDASRPSIRAADRPPA